MDKLTKNQQRILDALSSTSQLQHLRGFAKSLGLDPGNLSRELKTLMGMDLVKRQKQGNQVYFKVSPQAKLSSNYFFVDHQAIKEKLSEIEPDLIKLTQDLIRVPSVSGENPEKEIAEFIYKFAKSHGLHAKEITKDIFRPNLVIETDPEKKDVFLLVGHMDTIGIGSITDWDQYPFSGHISGGKIYGRGAADMKAGIACELFTLILIKELDLNLPFNVRLLLVSNEEGGSTDTPIFDQGMEFLIKNSLVKGRAAIYGYGGSYNIGIGHRGVLRIRIQTHGENVHTGSIKWQEKEKGANAVTGMAEILLALENLELPDTPHPSFPKHKNVITPGTMILHGGSAVSTVPAECTTVVDIRYLPGVSIKEVYQEIKNLCEEIIEKRPGLSVHLEKFVDIPAIIMPDNEPIVEDLKKSCEEVYGEPISTRGTGPANESFMLIKMGIPTVVFGPTGSGSHSANESINLNSLTKTIEVYLRTMEKFFKKIG